MKKFIKENWFKITILILIVYLLTILNNGIEIKHKGYIEDSKPSSIRIF